LEVANCDLHLLNDNYEKQDQNNSMDTNSVYIVLSIKSHYKGCVNFILYIGQLIKYIFLYLSPIGD